MRYDDWKARDTAIEQNGEDAHRHETVTLSTGDVVCPICDGLNPDALETCQTCRMVKFVNEQCHRCHGGAE